MLAGGLLAGAVVTGAVLVGGLVFGGLLDGARVVSAAEIRADDAASEDASAVAVRVAVVGGRVDSCVVCENVGVGVAVGRGGGDSVTDGRGSVTDGGDNVIDGGDPVTDGRAVGSGPGPPPHDASRIAQSTTAVEASMTAAQRNRRAPPVGRCAPGDHRMIIRMVARRHLRLTRAEWLLEFWA